MFPTSFDPDLLAYLTPEELAELDLLIVSDPTVWRPLPGPQSLAFHSEADIIGYGGAAGGGKTDLACGKSLTQHQKVLVLRREATQLTGIIDRFTELIGSRDGYNGAERIWRLPGKQIEFGSTPNLDDWNKYQGRPHDLLVFDEAANFLEAQVRALLGWLRSVDPAQRCQALLTFNPPTTAEGRWITAFFAPWLDKKHPKPAQPGELRWFAMIDGEEVEVPNGEPFQHGADLIKPMSRTFIPSRVSDNPYLMGTGYMATLQSLPEPLRSQMLYGDFNAGIEDDPWQVIPTAWVEAAQARWKRPDKLAPMDSLGVDVRAVAGTTRSLPAGMACGSTRPWSIRAARRPTGRPWPGSPSPPSATTRWCISTSSAWARRPTTSSTRPGSRSSASMSPRPPWAPTSRAGCASRTCAASYGGGCARPWTRPTTRALPCRQIPPFSRTCAHRRGNCRARPSTWQAASRSWKKSGARPTMAAPTCWPCSIHRSARWSRLLARVLEAD